MAVETAQDLAIDIDRQRLGTVYAKALLAAAEGRHDADRITDELNSFLDDVLVRSPHLEDVLASPRVPPTEKAQLLDRIFGGRMSDQLLTFLKVVGRHGRLDCLRAIRQAAKLELNQLRGRVAVRLTTATPLNDDLRAHIASRLSGTLGRQIDLECQIDPALIGGMLVRVGDTVYDGSVANQLARIREQAINQTFNQLRESLERFAVTS